MAEETPSEGCPICGGDTHVSPRYGSTVCNGCLSVHDCLVEPNGREITFGNISWSGGFASFYVVNGERIRTPRPIHYCYINGVRCYADEHRFGGIVIIKAQSQVDDLVNPQNPQTPPPSP